MVEVDDDIRIAEGLPAATFTEQAFLDRELETIFRTSWLVVPEKGDDPRPLDEQVAARGARVPITLLHRPLYLQRGWDDDVLRAFPNTCTHAWYPLVVGASRGPTLVCAQHGRRFDCTGKFVSQQGFGGSLPGFPRACDHLQSLPVANWRRLTWVNLDPNAAPLGDTLREVDATLTHMPAMPDRMSAEIRDVAGNWKQHAWNYLDQFHIGARQGEGRGGVLLAQREDVRFFQCAARGARYLAVATSTGARHARQTRRPGHRGESGHRPRGRKAARGAEHHGPGRLTQPRAWRGGGPDDRR